MSKLKELRQELGIKKRTDDKPQRVSIGFKIPVEMAKEALRQAEREQISMTSLMVKAIAKYLKEV